MISRFLKIALVVLLGGHSASADIVSAEFTQPTEKYAHGILGDAIEYSGMLILTDTGKSISIELPNDHVFEDLAPRLADMDGDGNPELIVIETDVRKGAALAIYDENGKIAETPHIGQSSRWLAPIGVADFNDDGDMDVAYIDRPHLAKILRVWSFRNGKLREIAQQKNLTNHKIGQDFISGGVRTCKGVAQMITVDGNWSRVMVTTIEGRKIISRPIGPFAGQVSLRRALQSC